jgi:hypothetical protein
MDVFAEKRPPQTAVQLRGELPILQHPSQVDNIAVEVHSRLESARRLGQQHRQRSAAQLDISVVLTEFGDDPRRQHPLAAEVRKY